MPITLTQTKEVPDGAQYIIFERGMGADQLREELDRVIEALDLEVRVFVTSKWNSAYLSECHECRGTGNVEQYEKDFRSSYQPCKKCNGKGVILS